MRNGRATDGESCFQGEDLIMELAEWITERSRLANAFGRVRLAVAWARAAHFKFSRQILRSAMWPLRAPAARSVRRVRGGAALQTHGRPPCAEVELLASTHCASRCPQRSDEFASGHEADGLRERYQRLHGSTT